MHDGLKDLPLVVGSRCLYVYRVVFAAKRSKIDLYRGQSSTKISGFVWFDILISAIFARFPANQS